jgi:GH43 family beta-xylosidase
MWFRRNFLLGIFFFTFLACSKKDIPTTVTPPPPADTTTFTNPLLASGPDPWVIQKDGIYYYTQTSQGNRIQIWKTAAMSRLNNVNPVTIFSKPVTGPNSQNVWAPELHFLDGKWYMYYAAGSGDINTAQRLFVLENSSADPTQGTWADKGEIKDSTADFWAIDPDVFEFNGNRYLLWSGHVNSVDFSERIYIARLENPWTLATARTEISAPTYNWEKIGAPPTVNEAPEAIKNPAGNLVLVYSASGCWTDDYSMGMLILKEGGNPLNPADWVKSANPVFTKKPENGAYGPGHCAFFKSPDGTQNWIIYHANSFANQGCGDFRNPRMQQFTWNPDGSPNFAEPVKINTPVKKPSGE